MQSPIAQYESESINHNAENFMNLLFGKMTIRRRRKMEIRSSKTMRATKHNNTIERYNRKEREEGDLN